MPSELRIKELLISYLDGETPPEVQRFIENRIYADPEAKEFYEDLRATKRILRHWKTPLPSSSFREKLLGRVHSGDFPIGDFDAEGNPTDGATLSRRKSRRRKAVDWFRRVDLAKTIRMTAMAAGILLMTFVGYKTVALFQESGYDLKASQPALAMKLTESVGLERRMASLAAEPRKNSTAAVGYEMAAQLALSAQSKEQAEDVEFLKDRLSGLSLSAWLSPRNFGGELNASEYLESRTSEEMIGDASLREATGDFAAARRLLEKAVPLAMAASDRASQIAIRTKLAFVLYHEGKLKNALEDVKTLLDERLPEETRTLLTSLQTMVDKRKELLTAADAAISHSDWKKLEAIGKEQIQIMAFDEAAVSFDQARAHTGNLETTYLYGYALAHADKSAREVAGDVFRKLAKQVPEGDVLAALCRFQEGMLLERGKFYLADASNLYLAAAERVSDPELQSLLKFMAGYNLRYLQGNQKESDQVFRLIKSPEYQAHIRLIQARTER